MDVYQYAEPERMQEVKNRASSPVEKAEPEYISVYEVTQRNGCAQGVDTIAVLAEGAKSPTRLDRLPNDLPKLKKWLERVARDGVIRACYEASGAGYVLHRAMKEWGYECEVIAPSLIPKRSGVQRKYGTPAQSYQLYGSAAAVRRPLQPFVRSSLQK